ncbi:MAG TPA: hypothetical protein ENK52_02930, partial [Saprospiraceae bacterium]|nr:hypothetical protein [Saprospiraceae bacterium]
LQENEYPNVIRSVIGLLFVFFVGIHSVCASTHHPTSKVWIDFIKESDTLFVKGLFIDLSQKQNGYQWEMNIHKEITADSIFNEHKNGKFIAEPFFPKIITETKIDLKKREYFVIVFNVFDFKNTLVGTDTLQSTQINPALIQPQSTPPLAAKLELPKPKITLDALEIDGLILDETRSKIGRDFYEIFFNKWSQPLGAKDFLITIKEMPARGIGARISIQVNGNIILYRFLQPRTELIEEQANISISYVKRYLMRNEDMKQDLEAGDQMGNGIY